MRICPRADFTTEGAGIEMHHQESQHDVDVLVAGYGPTGATIAALLGKRGWRVAVIDRAAAIYDKPRAITADQEAFRIFQEIGVADEVYETSSPHPGTDFVGLEGQVIKRFYPAPPPGPLGWTPSFMFVQPELEATLRRAVARMNHVQVFLENELIEYTQGPERVRARVRRLKDSGEVIISARYLVAADGASSVVRKQMDAGIEDLAFDEWWIVVDAWIRGPVELPERCVQYCRPSRPGTYIVGPGTLRRWEIKILPHETPEQFQSHDAVWRVLREFVDTNALEHCRTAIYRFHALVADEWRQGRVFLAGDAAHQMPPFMGQGLGAGVRDVFNLAWKLDAVMRGKVRSSLLDTYGEERKRHVRTVVGHAKSFGLVIGELDVVAARERDKRLGEELRSGRAETIRQRFIPGLEVGLIARDEAGAPAPGSGELLVQPWVREPGGTWRRLDDLLGPEFAIITTTPVALDEFDDELLARWKQLGGRIAVACGPGTPPPGRVDMLQLEDRENLLPTWLAEQRGVALIARPDRYVYGVAQTARTLRDLVSRLCAALIDEPGLLDPR
jgi:3-(3-hydroxy-phenyl)propionate hydroxylase